MDGLRVTWVILLLVGCGSSYEPLECDPAAAGEMALGYQVGGAYFPFPQDEVNGTTYLFIDGACRYWAPSPTLGPNRVVTGVLDEAMLDALNADLLTGPWPDIDGLMEEPSPDAPLAGLRRGEVTAISADTWHTSGSTFASLARRARDWSERLGMLGTPVDGPVRLETLVWPESVAPPSITVDWPLTTPLAELMSDTPYTGVSHVLTGEDAAQLREVAAVASVTVDGELVSRFRIFDVVPFADADGCLRPIFPGYCRVQPIW